MPVCHTCPHNGKHRRACLKCDWTGDRMGNATSHDGQNFVSLDEVQDFAQPAQKFANDSTIMADAFRAFMLLPSRLKVVVELRYRDLLGEERWSYQRIAKRCRITAQAAEHRHREALRQWPALQDLFAAKTSKQSRRRKSVT